MTLNLSCVTFKRILRGMQLFSEISLDRLGQNVLNTVIENNGMPIIDMSFVVVFNMKL